MARKEPMYYEDVESCVDHIVDYFDKEIKIESPLGLGKPVALINALYQRAKQDQQIKLTIFSALSLEKPIWSNELQKRFIKPFAERVWFGVPDLLYLKDLRADAMPPNVTLYEFYCQTGQYITQPKLQQNFISSNYTQIVRDGEILGANLFANMIAKSDTKRERSLSMSCNADLSLQSLAKHRRAKEMGRKRLCIGQINSNLPFMYGDAEVSPDVYDIIIESPRYNYPLFAAPRRPICIADYRIGINVSMLIKDGGTLQIGMGALGDAIAYALDLRHNFNEMYQNIVKHNDTAEIYAGLIEAEGGTAPLEKGLYGIAENLADGYLQLYKRGVLKRKVYHHAGIQRLLNQNKIGNDITPETLDILIEEAAVPAYLSAKEFAALQHIGIFKDDLTYADGTITQNQKNFSANLKDPDNREDIVNHCLGDRLKNGVLLTAGFFMGPKDFYETLRKMPEKERSLFEMTGIEVINQLYGDEALRSLQRKESRFCNPAMKATLLGHVVSDGLEDGTIISGVGGQYNLAAMALALADARLITMIKSTGMENGRLRSNIVYNYGNITIPRHLRDIIVTEYGIADIRGLCDKDIIMAMLNITDSRFQEDLLKKAKKHKKIPKDYSIPDRFRNNLPEALSRMLKPFKAKGFFVEFPYGADYSPIEFGIARSLRALNQSISAGKLGVLTNLIKEIPNKAPERATVFLERMQLLHPTSLKEKIMQKAMVLSLRLSGLI